MAIEEILCKSVTYQDGNLMTSGKYIGEFPKKIDKQDAFSFFKRTTSVKELIESGGIFGFIHSNSMGIESKYYRSGEKPHICVIATLDSAMDLVKNKPEDLEKYLQHNITFTTRGGIVKIVPHKTEEASILTLGMPDSLRRLDAISKIIFTNQFPRDTAPLTGEQMHQASIRSGFDLIELDAKFVSLKDDEYNLIQTQFDHAKKALCKQRAMTSKSKAAVKKSTSSSTLTTTAWTIVGFIVGFAMANWDALSHQFKQMKPT